MDITQYIRDIKDFPKEGVVFKDITAITSESNCDKTGSEGIYFDVKRSENR